MVNSTCTDVVSYSFGYGSTSEGLFDNNLVIASELKKRMKNGNKLKVIGIEYAPQEILGIFRFFNLFVGMKSHSIIFSLMMKAPMVVLIYVTKTIKSLKRRDEHRCISITIDGLDVDKLKKTVDALKA